MKKLSFIKIRTFLLGVFIMSTLGSSAVNACGCNQAAKKDYDVLYHFKGKEIEIVEIKNNKLPENAPKEQIYNWLLFSKKDQKLSKLEFESMGKEADGKTSWRRFKDSSSFSFGDSEGSFKVKDQKDSVILSKINLVNSTFSMNDDGLKNSVEEYLKKI